MLKKRSAVALIIFAAVMPGVAQADNDLPPPPPPSAIISTVSPDAGPLDLIKEIYYGVMTEQCRKFGGIFCVAG